MSTSHTNGESVKLECGCRYSCSREETYEDEGGFTFESPVKCFPKSMCEHHAVYWREVVPQQVDHYIEADHTGLADEVIETVRGLGFQGVGVEGEIHFIPSHGRQPGVSTLFCKIYGLNINLRGKTDSDAELPATITRRGPYTLYTRIDRMAPSNGSS